MILIRRVGSRVTSHCLLGAGFEIPSAVLICVCFLTSLTFAQESVPAAASESISKPALEFTSAPECIQYSQSRMDVALAKSSRVDNDLFSGLNGKKIHTINYKSISVFDEENPDENNSLYLWLNDLHVNTRPGVVKSQLLFKVGDLLSEQSIHESERILRSRRYLVNAYILPSAVCGDQVDLLVVTQDAWALEPQFSLSRKSASTQTGFGISDGNIGGTGNAFSISYFENQQRNGVGYNFSNPHFLNKQISMKLFYEDTNDGHNSLVELSHPFYALDTPWAAGFHLEDISLVDTIRSRGKVINEFTHQEVMNEIFFGKATDVNSAYTQRWLVGFTQEEQKYYATSITSQAIPEENKTVYPWLEYQYLENKFGVYKNVNQIQRPEDIGLGQNFSFRLGYGGKSFDNPDEVVRFKSVYSNIKDIDGHHIFEYGVNVDGKQHLQLSDIDSVILGTYISYNLFQNDKNRWYAHASYDIGQDLTQDQELTVGDLTGLRGYPTDYVRGNKRYVFTLERRYFSDFHIFNLLRVGGVVFFDMGKAWGLDDSYSPLLTDVGIGLRFSSTKIRIGNVVHIDIAMPTSAKTGISQYQLTIGAESKF